MFSSWTAFATSFVVVWASPQPRRRCAKRVKWRTHSTCAISGSLRVSGQVTFFMLLLQVRKALSPRCPLPSVTMKDSSSPNPLTVATLMSPSSMTRFAP